MTRSFVDLSGGTQALVTKTAAAADISLSQPSRAVLDAAPFSNLELQMRVFNVQLGAGATPANSPRLILETSMQNPEGEDPVWEELVSLALQNAFDDTWTKGFTIPSGVLRYVRWRLFVPARGAVEDVDLAFQITGYGAT